MLRSTADIPNPEALMQTYTLAMQRFAGTVILPLAAIFRVSRLHFVSRNSRLTLRLQLDPSSISVFYDSAGPLIAFNRGGALYLNALVQGLFPNEVSADPPAGVTTWRGTIRRSCWEKSRKP